MGTGSADLLPGGQTFEAIGDSQSGDIASELQGADLLSGNFEQLLFGETSNETLLSQEGIDPVTGLDTTSRIVRNNTEGMVLDVDGDGEVTALTDGILIVRFMFGLTGAPLIQDAVADNAVRSDAGVIASYLEGVFDLLDIDGNNQTAALTDGILVVRFLFGLRGAPLIQDAVADDATVTTPEELEDSLDVLSDPTPTEPPEGTIFWVGESGDWSDPENWNTGVLPGPNDVVVIDVPSDATVTYDSRSTTSVADLFSQENLVISDGTLRVTGDSQLNNGLTLSNGTLDADGEIIVAGNSSWTGGTITGDGELTNTGTLDWTGGRLTGNLTNSGSLTISGGSIKSLNGVLNNSGTITHNATGDVDFNSGTLNNQIDGVYDLQAGVLDSIFSLSSSGNVNNSGVFRKSGEETAATVDVDFNLTGGTIDAQAGTLLLTRGGNSTGGSYSAADGGVLDYSDGTHNFRGDYSGSGEGKVRINGATISNRDGETANFNLTGNLFEWIAGRIDSDGGLTNSGTLNISGEDSKFLIGTFNNTGTIVHTSGLVDSSFTLSSSGNLNRTSPLTNRHNLCYQGISAVVTAPITGYITSGLTTNLKLFVATPWVE